MGLSALWTVCPVSYPLKPPSVGGPGDRPLYEVDSGTRLRVEPGRVEPVGSNLVGSNLVKLSSAHSCRSSRYLVALSPSSMKHVSFQLLLPKSDMRPFNSCVASFGAASQIVYCGFSM